MREVIVSGIGMTNFGKFLDRNNKSLAEEAVSAALNDAGITADQVEQVLYGNAAAGVITGQEMIRGQAALRDMGLDGAPMFNVENACASSSSGFHLAWLMIASGQAECALVIGSEKMTPEDKPDGVDAPDGIAMCQSGNVKTAQLRRHPWKRLA